MQITISHPQPGVTVLHLTGRLDPDGSRAFDRIVATELTGIVPRLVVDCSALEHVASYGLRSLLTAAKRTSQAGGRLVFCGAPPAVAHIFELSGFDQQFSSPPTVDAAVAALA